MREIERLRRLRQREERGTQDEAAHEGARDETSVHLDHSLRAGPFPAGCASFAAADFSAMPRAGADRFDCVVRTGAIGLATVGSRRACCRFPGRDAPPARNYLVVAGLVPAIDPLDGRIKPGLGKDRNTGNVKELG